MTALAVCVSTVLAGCTTVSERYDARARALGFELGEVTGTGFRHTVYARTSPAPRHVRVYFEGKRFSFMRRCGCGRQG